MAKRSNLILLAVSLVLALVATLVIVKELPKSGGAVGAVGVTGTASVVVVAKNVPAQTPIDSTDVQVQQVPAGSVESGAITDPSQVIGQYSSTGWVTGQQVIPGMFESAAQANIANTIPSGERAFTIPNSAIAGVDYLIVPGDTVDLLFYGQPGGTSSTVMSDLKVVYVDHTQVAGGADQLSPSTSGLDSITVAVTPQQAQQLAKLVSLASVGTGSTPDTLHVLLHGTSNASSTSNSTK